MTCSVCLYYWCAQIRRMSWAVHMARMGDRRGAYRVLMGRPEGKRSRRKYKPRYQDDIKMHLQEVG